MIPSGRRPREQHPSFDAAAHHALARRAAAEGVVLLKNDGTLLPLDGRGSGWSVAVIGAMAKHPRYQGAGSSVITPTRLDNALDAFVARLGAGRVVYAAGYDLGRDVPGREEDADAGLIAEAVAAARAADVAVVFAGLPPLTRPRADHTAWPAPRHVRSSPPWRTPAPTWSSF